MIKYAIEIKKMTIKGVITHANNISSVFMIIQQGNPPFQWWEELLLSFFLLIIDYFSKLLNIYI